MGRNYNVRIEVKSAKLEQIEDDVIVMEFTDFDEDDAFEDFKAWSGPMHLGGGQSERQAHDELREKILEIDPRAKVKTYWHYLETWDESFGDEI
jgi:hypothetical protein